MDARGRRYHVHRGDSDAREGADHPDRAAGRRDEGIRSGGVEPAAGPRGTARDSAGRVHADRRAPAPAGWSGAEGWSVGGDRDRDGAGVAVVPPSVAPRRGDDGRAHAARRILPIGGLKEKLTAAARAGVKTVLVPARNQSDIVDVPDEVKQLLDIKPVETIDEVLELALLEPHPLRPVAVRARPSGQTEARP